MAALTASKAGKSLRSLRFGPSQDGVFAESTGKTSADMQLYFSSSCPKLLLLVAWELCNDVPPSGDGWMWKRLESGALQGSQLSQ